MKRLVHRTSFAVALTGLVLVGLGATAANASTFLALDVPELVQRSDWVVQGEVLELNSHWDDEGRVIVTDVLLGVKDSVIGKIEGPVWVRTFGGTVGDYTVEAIGFPRFAMGDQVLLFLNQREGLDNTIRVTGHQLGHYRIVERGGQKIAVPTLEAGVSLITESGQAAIAPREVPLSQLKGEVQLLTRRGGVRPSN